MKKNMSTLDRIVRVIVAAVLAVLIAAGALTGTWAVVLGIVAVVFLLTSIVGFCPLYALLGWSTAPKP